MLKSYRKYTQRIRQERTDAVRSRPIVRCTNNGDGTMRKEVIRWTI